MAQTQVDSFNVVNLFFRYDFDGQGLLQDLALTANVENVLDEEPPEFRGVTSTTSTAGYAATLGGTLGRLIQVGVEKKF